ncbi:hypothetical protein FGM00_14860 [Aggregatimonas sangjinii]|uniref:Uncharacterized protein n=1 Tax=Aggregatimonas sangjinii TaxID=2583587 RepID=A0A5B7SS35_9FLAO|nr:hypothetical protein [Aggregatimonas sangjinii]QCX01327.1 hypothetical protein FGM00_14860 [Aggregatimonas sangjinii]
MNEKDNKKLEELVDKLMRETVLETPSADFTSKVLSQVDSIATSEVTTYRPLISKSVWIGLCALLVGTVIYSFFNTTAEPNWFETVDFSVFTNSGIGNQLSDLVSSKAMFYAAILFASMFVVQISFLKNHFNRRLRV